MILRRAAIALLSCATVVVACQDTGSPKDELSYDFMGRDSEGRSYYLDRSSFGFRTPIAPPALKTATVLLRRDSGYTEVAHVSIRCETGEWTQGAFAGEQDDDVVIPQNWGDISDPNLPDDHPILQVVGERCKAI